MHYNQVNSRINRIRRKMADLQDDMNNRCVEPSGSKLRELAKTKGRSNFIDANINLRAIMILFQLRIDGRDVEKLLSIFGVTGGRSYERNFVDILPL